MSQVDPAVFYWQNEKCEVTGVLACHADYFFWAGSEYFVANVIPVLKSAFHVGREEHESFSYVGMDIASVGGIVQVHQHSYIDNLQPVHLQTA